jgi:hypothetical protein
MSAPDCMALHGSHQKGKFFFTKVDVVRADRQREPSGTRPMPGVMAVALASHIMQEGEILDDP